MPYTTLKVPKRKYMRSSTACNIPVYGDAVIVADRCCHRFRFEAVSALFRPVIRRFLNSTSARSMQSVPDPWELVAVLDYADVGRSGLSFILEISPLWLFGLLIGFLSPKQPLLSDFKSFVASCVGVALGLSAQSNFVLKAMMCLHGTVFIQTLWLRNTDPGTFHRYLESILASIAGNAADTGKSGRSKDHAAESAPDEDENEWLITDADLDFFRARVERKDAPIRAEPWQLMVNKTLPNELQYSAYRRILKDIKKTEYLSVSITTNSTPHEVRASQYVRKDKR